MDGRLEFTWSAVSNGWHCPSLTPYFRFNRMNILRIYSRQFITDACFGYVGIFQCKVGLLLINFIAEYLNRKADGLNPLCLHVVLLS